MSLASRFMHHAPPDQETVVKYETMRRRCLLLAEHIVESCPDSRERSLAITHLEEVMFWANAAVARYPKGTGTALSEVLPPPPPPPVQWDDSDYIEKPPPKDK